MADEIYSKAPDGKLIISKAVPSIAKDYEALVNERTNAYARLQSTIAFHQSFIDKAQAAFDLAVTRVQEADKLGVDAVAIENVEAVIK